MNRIDELKLAGMNIGSWFGAIVSIQDVHQLFSLFAVAGSITVSAYTVWWIKKQAKNMDGKHLRKED